MKERDHLEGVGILVDGKLISNWVFKKWDGACTGLIWLRVGTSGRLVGKW
jgi:hypothetical protein